MARESSAREILVQRRTADSTALSHVITAAAFVWLDLSVLWLAFGIAYFLRYSAGWVPAGRGTTPVSFADWIPFGLLFSLVTMAGLALAGHYRRRLGSDLLDELPSIVRSTLIAVGVVVILIAFLPIAEYSRLVVVYTWIILIPCLLLERTLLRGVLARLHGRGWNIRRVLIVGTTTISKMVMQRMLGRRRHGYQLVGFLHESFDIPGTGAGPLESRGDFGRFKCLGSVEDLAWVLRERHIDDVICALPAQAHADIANLCAQCDLAGVAVKLVPDLFELSLSRVRMDHLAGIPLIDVRQGRPGVITRSIKRLVDVVLAGAALALVSPIILATAVAIKLDSPGPVLVNQQRIGKHGKPFTFFKFRSMYVGAEHHREALAEQSGVIAPRIFKDRNDPRRTRVGRFIRKWSIDELPQLLNVLRGDMSMVGPRPPIPAEVAHYQPHHYKRLEVPGGITGLWQVSGRSNIESFEEIITMDTYYVDCWTLALDFRILLHTVVVVLARTGAY
jgi:exopolysaccharide biosynthesis polyprenyl glycosylphosphotransferase